VPGVRRRYLLLEQRVAWVGGGGRLGGCARLWESPSQDRTRAGAGLTTDRMWNHSSLWCCSVPSSSWRLSPRPRSAIGAAV